MDLNRKKALSNCYDSFRRDLDPSIAFLHSLHAKGVLTEDQLLELKATSSRETKVALLHSYLPHRGPNAFHHFSNEVRKDHSWLADELSNELSKVLHKTELVKSKLIQVINCKLVPLVYMEDISHRVENRFEGDLTELLSNLLITLERNCCYSNALKVELRNTYPIHERIKDKMLQISALEELSRANKDMKKQIKDTKKQIKEAEKVAKENQKLQQENKRLRERQAAYKQMEKDCKKIKGDHEKLKKERDALKVEIDTLKLQLSNSVERERSKA